LRTVLTNSWFNQKLISLVWLRPPLECCRRRGRPFFLLPWLRLGAGVRLALAPPEGGPSHRPPLAPLRGACPLRRGGPPSGGHPIGLRPRGARCASRLRQNFVICPRSLAKRTFVGVGAFDMQLPCAMRAPLRGRPPCWARVQRCLPPEGARPRRAEAPRLVPTTCGHEWMRLPRMVQGAGGCGPPQRLASRPNRSAWPALCPLAPPPPAAPPKGRVRLAQAGEAMLGATTPQVGGGRCAPREACCRCAGLTTRQKMISNSIYRRVH
jgi:hypothetical protein